MVRISLKTQDEFEMWLFHMSDFLDDLLTFVPAPLKEKLDFSVDSLDALEEWILQNYPDTKSMLERSETKITNSCACYIGQTYRKAVGGKWSVELEDENNAFFQMPILIETAGFRSKMCPHTLTTASADRRRGDYLSTILKRAMKRGEEQNNSCA